MHRRLQIILKKLSISSGETQRILDYIGASRSHHNVFLEHALSAEDDLRLLSLLLAELISNRENQEETIARFFDHLESNYFSLSDFDQGVYWHLKGHQDWKRDRALYPTLGALNRSQQLLDSANDALAKPYLARVYDTFGQIYYHMGYLEDALKDFRVSLDMRSPRDDAYGIALTSGNLGRVHMDLGNWEQSIEYFQQDLEIMLRDFPNLKRIHSQLFSHLAYAHLQVGRIDQAADLYHQSLAIAIKCEYQLGQFFASVGLGKISVSKKDIEDAGEWRDRASEILERDGVPAASSLQGLIQHLSGSIALQDGQLPVAENAFRRARSLYEASTRISPIEMAQLILDLAEVTEALDDLSTTALLLSDALAYLDSSSAVEQRREVESRLKQCSKSQWILHATRRLTGKRSVEKLLNKTGVPGFSVEKTQVVVMFADIRGFTKISEEMDPEELIKLLNTYLSRMVRTVNLYDGYVVQIQGDAILAVFSLPERQPDDVPRSILTALIMLEENRRLNVRFASDYPDIHIGIGIHFGEVVTGLIGSAVKRSYTMIGDVVNSTSRIEGLTKILGVPILVSEEVRSALRGDAPYHFLPMGQFIFYGRVEPVMIFALMGVHSQDPQGDTLQAWIGESTLAYRAFANKRFDEAFSIYQDLYEATGITGFQFLGSQAIHFKNNPPSANWSGQIELQTK